MQINLKSPFAQYGVLLLLLAGWELLPRLGFIPANTFPPLSTVIATIFDSKELGRHALASTARAFGGLAAAVAVGLPLGLLLGGWFPRIQQGLEPLMELFGQANPVILSHIVVLFIGIGTRTQIFVIAWLSIWPIAFSAINGVRSVDPLLLKSARALGLGRWRLFTSVILPSAAPSLITGLRLAAGYSFIMLIAAELMGATTGLGYIMATSAETADMKSLAAAALIVTFLGVATDTVLKQIGRRVVAWGYQGAVE
jgi:ABC-type nitrate/sulfonate/bicarbonate transport system permease component